MSHLLGIFVHDRTQEYFASKKANENVKFVFKGNVTLNERLLMQIYKNGMHPNQTKQIRVENSKEGCQ